MTAEISLIGALMVVLWFSKAIRGQPRPLNLHQVRSPDRVSGEEVTKLLNDPS